MLLSSSLLPDYRATLLSSFKHTSTLPIHNLPQPGLAQHVKIAGVRACPQEEQVRVGHFRVKVRHFTVILSSFVPNFTQLLGPRGQRPQQDVKSARFPIAYTALISFRTSEIHNGTLGLLWVDHHNNTVAIGRRAQQ